MAAASARDQASPKPAVRRGMGFVFQNFALFPHMSVTTTSPMASHPGGEPAASAGCGEVVSVLELAASPAWRTSGPANCPAASASAWRWPAPVTVRPRAPRRAAGRARRQPARPHAAELRRIRAELGIAFLHVTGSEIEALAMGDRLIVLDRGRIAQFDRPGIGPTRSRRRRAWRASAIVRPHRRTRRGRRLPLPTAAGSRSAAPTGPRDPAYAIRQDLIGIAPAGSEPAATKPSRGEVRDERIFGRGLDVLLRARER